MLPPPTPASAHVPPPPRAPSVERETALAVAVRRAPMWARRAERSEVVTVRPEEVR